VPAQRSGIVETACAARLKTYFPVQVATRTTRNHAQLSHAREKESQQKQSGFWRENQAHSKQHQRQKKARDLPVRSGKVNERRNSRVRPAANVAARHRPELHARSLQVNERFNVMRLREKVEKLN